MNVTRIFVAAVSLMASTSIALADCTGIPNAAAQPDGAWLFRDSETWRPVHDLGALIADGRSRTVSFVYVANEPDSGLGRRGLLVIKGGVVGTVSTKDDEQVRLTRDAYLKMDVCESYPAFSGAWVSGRSYDDYHDSGYRTPDDAKFRAFHVKYAARSGCRWSNDAKSDAYFAGKWQSNRSQFSFDPSVVAKGQHSQFLALFGITPAYAGQSMTNRRVEIKRYRADKNGLACVTFQVKLKPGSFVRINDLERGRGFRGTELSWKWPG
ncbi:hypothetical protein FJ958_28205 [Mesorhizobium sp. B2-3-5]|nr:hypothetical protein FJ958_28205 [Mesorhizobium sp. B2-3-5]